MVRSTHKWSFAKGKLYIEPIKSGVGHQGIHIRHNLPVSGEKFDAVVRGRCLMTKKYKSIDVVSLGKYDDLPNEIYNAILSYFGLDKSTPDVVVLLPGWDLETIQPVEKA